MTPKRWFWSLIGASLLWCGLGYHYYGGKSGEWAKHPENPPLMLRMQQVTVTPPRLILIMPEFIFTGIQGIATNVIERVTRPRETVSVEELQEQNRDLKAQIAQLSGMLAELQRSYGGLRTLGGMGITSDDVLPATVITDGSGPGTTVMHLDKGAADGVKRGMAVVAPLEQVTVLGRIVYVGQKDCYLMLLTDPQMRVTADIVRNSTTPITAEPCLVEGFGSGIMKCETVNVQQANAPMRGDFVRLVDAGWPAKTRFMLIGQIEDVRARTNQALRYDLHITPPRPITSLRTVMILTKE
jgi:hypothetical protein